ncbi:MAG: glycerophosphodiester phosphodiesterase family protein [Pseudomonadota bacterium]
MTALKAVEGTPRVGVRPLFLVEDMDDGELKTKLQSCASSEMKQTLFSIAHRGAPMQFPEHTVESYVAAAQQGAGIQECDVTFTKDKELVCRHAQCDLHTTTNILETPLASKCSIPFQPANGDQPAQVRCCASDLTLAEFRTLKGKMDAGNPKATTPEEYMDATANWRTDLYASRGTLMTHAESIELFKAVGAKMTPELKSPDVEMPFDGFSQQDYAQKLVDEYKAAGVPASDVFAQSFNLDDVKYWIENEPDFGAQAVYLDGRYSEEAFDVAQADTWSPSMAELAEAGVKYLAPPMWMLVRANGTDYAASDYAKAAKEAGLGLITWTLERSGPLGSGGGWYYQTATDATTKDGDMYELLDTLAMDVGIEGIFSDWPATVTYYASCMGLK